MFGFLKKEQWVDILDTGSNIQNWATRLDKRLLAIGLGLTIGVTAGLIGLLMAVVGPIIAFAVIVGILAGLYILTDLTAALYGVILLVIWLPFGTFPIKIALTPTLIDIILVAFVLVYLVQWMTGRRHQLNLTPVHFLAILYLMWLIIAFVLGMRYALPTSTHLRQFAETLLSISLIFILVDCMQDRKTLRRLVLVVLITVGLQALGAIVLYALPDSVAENILVRLSRIGYPDGGVIRYIEDNPELGERAIGTWVDPNALGGILATSAVMIAPQLFASRPILRYRWLTFIAFVTISLALFLTNSRASFLALGIGLMVIALVRYRRFLPFILLAILGLLLMPQTQNYIERLLQAFQGADLATQMRIGEWTDSLRLISRYPFFGVGFTGTPDNDIYTDVANMYLIMANQIGLIGVGIYLMLMIGVFAYGWKAWRLAKTDTELDAIHLGYHAALLTSLANAVADLYFFRLDFQASITWFWLVVALALASSRLSLNRTEPTVAKSA